MRLLSLAALAVCAGCSITQPHPDLVSLTDGMRLSGGVDITAAHRWVLPPLSEVALHPEDDAQASFADAARAGLSSSLRISDAASWHLIVHWPQPESVANEQKPSRWRKWLPEPASRQALVVDVVDASGAHWVQRLHVDVKPWWFGRDWRNEEAIVKTFAAVGRALTGT